MGGYEVVVVHVIKCPNSWVLSTNRPTLTKKKKKQKKGKNKINLPFSFIVSHLMPLISSRKLFLSSLSASSFCFHLRFSSSAFSTTLLAFASTSAIALSRRANADSSVAACCCSITWLEWTPGGEGGTEKKLGNSHILASSEVRKQCDFFGWVTIGLNGASR